MKPQTKLKVAAEEIKDILRKHDIAAAISLHTPGHAEHVLHLTTPYSCAYIYNDAEVRFYSQRKDYKTEEEQVEKLSNTANMLKLLTDVTAYNYLMLEPLTEKFDELTGAEHS